MDEIKVVAFTTLEHDSVDGNFLVPPENIVAAQAEVGCGTLLSLIGGAQVTVRETQEQVAKTLNWRSLASKK